MSGTPRRRYRKGESCPVCFASGAGKPFRSRCAVKETATGHSVFECVTGSDVPGFRRLGEAGLGCSAFVAIGDAEPLTPRGRRTPSARPKPSTDPHAVDATLGALLAIVAGLHATSGNAEVAPHGRAVREHLEPRGLALDWTNYSATVPARLQGDLTDRLAEIRPSWRTDCPWLASDAGLVSIVFTDSQPLVLQVVRDAAGRAVHLNRRQTRGRGTYYAFPGPAWHIHVVPGFWPRFHETGTLLIGEGIFKADIGAAHLNAAGIATRSVYSLGSALGDLDRIFALCERAIRDAGRDTWDLLIATDIGDLVRPTKGDVRKQIATIWLASARSAERHGAIVRWLDFDVDAAGSPKGIDDAIQAGQQPRRVTWDDLVRRYPMLGEAFGVRWAPARSRRGVDAARTETTEALRGWTGDRPLWLSGPPGLAKTTIALGEVLSRLHDGRERVAVLTERTREHVAEKHAKARALIGAGGLGVEVVQLLGANEDPGSGSWCEHHGRRSFRASLFMPGCFGCPALDVCKREDGRHLREKAKVAGAVRRALSGDGPPLLVAATDKGLLCDLDTPQETRCLPDSPLVVLDDVGGTLGLGSEGTVYGGDIEAALERLGELTDHNVLVAVRALEEADARGQAAVPDVVLSALILGPVLQWLHRLDRTTDELREIADRLPGPLKNRIKDGRLAGGQFETERGELLPRLSVLACEILRATLRGSPPAVLNAGRKVQADRGGRRIVAFPSFEMRRLIQAGRVLWLAVPPMPGGCAEALGVDVRTIDADPPRALVFAVTSVNAGAGRGQTKAVRDHRIEAVVQAIHDRAERDPGFQLLGVPIRTVAGVLAKRNADRLGLQLVGHFGCDERATDRMAGVDCLIVREFREPPAALLHRARLLASVCGLPEPIGGGEREARRWFEDSALVKTTVPADPVVRQCYDFDALDYVLNAAGRGRFFSTETPQLVLLFAAPREGIRVDAEITFEALCALAAIDTELPTRERLNAERAVEAAARQADEAELISAAEQRLVDSGEEPTRQALVEATGLARKAIDRFRARHPLTVPIPDAVLEHRAGLPDAVDVAKLLGGELWPADAGSRARSVRRYLDAITDALANRSQGVVIGGRDRRRRERCEAVLRALARSVGESTGPPADAASGACYDERTYVAPDEASVGGRIRTASGDPSGSRHARKGACDPEFGTSAEEGPDAPDDASAGPEIRTAAELIRCHRLAVGGDQDRLAPDQDRLRRLAELPEDDTVARLAGMLEVLPRQVRKLRSVAQEHLNRGGRLDPRRRDSFERALAALAQLDGRPYRTPTNADDDGQRRNRSTRRTQPPVRSDAAAGPDVHLTDPKAGGGCLAGYAGGPGPEPSRAARTASALAWRRSTAVASGRQISTRRSCVESGARCDR